MAKQKSNFRMNTAGMKQLTQIINVSLEQTAEAIRTDILQEQTMPYDTGHLQGAESTFVDYSNIANGSVSLVSSTPYARRLYFHPEYHFQKTENPNAGAGWFEPYKTGGSKSDFVERAFRELLRRNGL